MLRMTLLAATAALLATSASAQSIRISTIGKTPIQLKAEVTKAAEKLCWRETAGSSFPIDAQASCVEHAVRAALARSPGPAYAQR
jgi:hypothetical protein